MCIHNIRTLCLIIKLHCAMWGSRLVSDRTHYDSVPKCILVSRTDLYWIDLLVVSSSVQLFESIKLDVLIITTTTLFIFLAAAARTSLISAYFCHLKKKLNRDQFASIVFDVHGFECRPTCMKMRHFMKNIIFELWNLPKNPFLHQSLHLKRQMVG